MSKEKVHTCQVCAGKMTVEEAYQAMVWNGNIYETLCTKHCKQVDEKANRRMEQ
jgi:hypothetical protein